MKKYLKFIGIALISLSMFSCNKDDFNYPEGTVGTSKITYYPIFKVTGNQYMSIAKGATYTEPGVGATENGNDLKVTITGSVNSGVVGAYVLTYTATNKDGYSASVTRTVAVTAPDATAAANDLSGSFVRSSNGQVAVWTKIGPGVYQVNNPGGAAGADGVVAIAFNQTGNTVSILPQNSNIGQVSSGDESFNIQGGKLLGFSWKILNAGYGTGLRTFVKQ